MPRFLTGLRAQIVFNLTLLMIAATALIGFVVLKVSEQSLMEQKIKTAGIILHSIQNSITFEDSASNRLNDQDIGRLIEIFFRSGDIESIIVVDRDINIIAGLPTGHIGDHGADDNISQAVNENSRITRAEKGKVSLYSPLYIGSEIKGGLRIDVSTKDVRQMAGRAQMLIIFYALLNSTALIILSSFLLSRTIVKPIDALVKATETVASGDLHQKIRIKRLNEFGLLAESFNRMTLRLKENQESLEANFRHLEKAHHELKVAQSEIMRAEKMASVGRLAAGIAHEIGNPLSAILGYIGIIQAGATGTEQSDYLMRIEREIQRINRIVRDLLDYARPGELRIAPTDANLVITVSIDIVSTQKGFEKLTLRQSLSDIPPVMVDSHQLQQVLVNLFINASDAMPEGGDLAVRSGFSGDTSLTGGTIIDERYVEISVADSGSGMTDEEIKQIFDPFYTTKEPGKGTGLGLAISQRIIESFGGRIKVSSEKGKGSEFRILLPAMKPDA